MVAVAVNVTEPPLHIEVVVDVIDTEAVSEMIDTATEVLPLSHPFIV